MFLVLVVVSRNISWVFKSRSLKMLKDNHAGDRISTAWNPTNCENRISFLLLQVMLNSCYPVCGSVYIDIYIYLTMHYIQVDLPVWFMPE